MITRQTASGWECRFTSKSLSQTFVTQGDTKDNAETNMLLLLQHEIRKDRGTGE